MFVCVYVYDYRGKQVFYSFSYWGFFILLVLIAGLRYRIGTDSIIYERTYHEIPTLFQLGNYKFDSTRFEPGYIIFSSIPKTFSPDFVWLQIFQSLCVNAVIFWFILKNTPHRFLCLAIYFVVLYLNLNTQVLREALAVSVFLLAWPFFRDGKWLYYYLLAALASFMHTSGFITLLLPIACLPGVRQLFKVGKRTIFICLIILLAGYLIQLRFTTVFKAIAVTDRMMDRVSTYSNNGMTLGKFNLLGAIGYLIQYCVYPLIALYFFKIADIRKDISKKLKETAEKKWQKRKSKGLTLEEYNEKIEKRDKERWMTMTLIGVYIMVFAMPIYIFTRYSNYFGIFLFATVSTWAFNTVTTKKKRLRIRFSYWCVILLPFFFFHLYFYNSPINKSGTIKNYNVYYPYNSRFEPQMDQKREEAFRYLEAR